MNPCTALPPRPRRTKHGQAPAATQALQRRNALVEAHRHLVPPVAHHYWQRCPEPQDDLVQVGLLGLIRAAELFRPSQQTPFAAFARPHIRGAILHYLRDRAPVVRLPRRQSELQTRLHRLEEQMASSTSAQSPGEEEICRHLAIRAEQWQLLQRHRNLSRPAPLNPDLLEQLASPAGDPQEDPEESQERVEALLAALDPRTQQVLRWVVLQGWSYRRAGAALQVSAMTVQRCLHRGLATLRGQLSDSSEGNHRPPSLTPGLKLGRVPSAAQGWPSRHSPPPTAAPGRPAKR